MVLLPMGNDSLGLCRLDLFSLPYAVQKRLCKKSGSARMCRAVSLILFTGVHLYSA